MLKTLLIVSTLTLAPAAYAALPVQTLVVSQAEPAEPAAAPAAEPEKPKDEAAKPDEKPSDLKDVVQSTGAVIDAVKTGKWIAIASALIMLLLNLFRLPQLGSLVKKIPSRVRIVIPIVLGAGAGILGSITGGLPWYEALTVGLVTGPTAVFQNEILFNAILGKRQKRREAENGGAAKQS